MHGGSVVRRRMLGRELRLLRERAGLTLDVAAPRLDYSTSTVSRIETGQQAPDVHGVKSMLDLYDAGDRWDELLTLTREVRQKGWWRAYGIGDHSYVGFETEATLVQDFTLDYVPGLLQVPAYSRALFRASVKDRSDEQLADAVAVRSIRQHRLTSATDPLQLRAVVDESVLHRAIGGPEVFAAQLAHLVAAAQLESVTLQVLPLAVAPRAAMGSTLSILSFGDIGEPDLGYLEHALGSLLFQKESEVERARLVFDRLRSDALDPGASLALIREVADRA